MRPSVRHFNSPDVDLETFRPDNDENFSFLLQALVGPADQIGEESVDFLVCTVQSLMETVERDRIVFGRSLVIVNTTDITSILDAVRRQIERIEAATWGEIGVLLARQGVYEFEDSTA